MLDAASLGLAAEEEGPPQRDPRYWLNRKQASEYLGRVGCPVAPQTLANMAANGNSGGGPPYTKIARKIVRYHRDDLREWANQNARRVL